MKFIKHIQDFFRREAGGVPERQEDSFLNTTPFTKGQRNILLELIEQCSTPITDKPNKTPADTAQGYELCKGALSLADLKTIIGEQLAEVDKLDNNKENVEKYFLSQKVLGQIQYIHDEMMKHCTGATQQHRIKLHNSNNGDNLIPPY